LLEKRTILFIILLSIALATAQAQTIYLKHKAIDSTEVNLLELGIQPSTHGDVKSLYTQKEKTLNFLHKEGYLEAYSDPLVKENDSTFTNFLYIGAKTTIAILYVDTSDWPKEISNTLDIDKRNQLVLPFIKLEEQIIETQAKWKNLGHSFAEVQLQNIRKNKDTLFGDLYVNKSDLRRIDSITIKGYEKFPVKILYHQFGLKPKKRLDQKKIQKASQTIQATGIAKETREPEILYEKDKSTVYLYFEKLNNNYFDGIVGFATNEDTGKLEFSGNLDLSLHNNLNQGEKLSIHYRADGGDQQEIKIGLETPYIANSPISASGGIQIFKKDSTYTNTNLNAKVNLTRNNWSIYLGYEQATSVNQLEESSINQSIVSLDGKFYFIGASYTLYQNDLLQPLASYADIRIGTGNRETDNDKENQLKIEIDGHHNISLGRNHSIYAGVMARKLWSKTYYLNELFRIGGLENVRGFNENSIDATQTLTLQTEYRYRLSREMYLHSIADIGWIENKVLNIKDTLIGLGFGLGIYNKLGLMSIQIANGITSQEKLDFDKTRIHISLHTRF